MEGFTKAVRKGKKGQNTPAVMEYYIFFGVHNMALRIFMLSDFLKRKIFTPTEETAHLFISCAYITHHAFVFSEGQPQKSCQKFVIAIAYDRQKEQDEIL
jgi:hypothetical protein